MDSPAGAGVVLLPGSQAHVFDDVVGVVSVPPVVLNVLVLIVEAEAVNAAVAAASHAALPRFAPFTLMNVSTMSVSGVSTTDGLSTQAPPMIALRTHAELSPWTTIFRHFELVNPDTHLMILLTCKEADQKLYRKKLQNCTPSATLTIGKCIGK